MITNTDKTVRLEGGPEENRLVSIWDTVVYDLLQS